MQSPAQPYLPETGFVRDGLFRDLLGVSHTTMWRWTRTGLLPTAYRIGPNTVARRVEDVRAYLADPEGWQAANVPTVTPDRSARHG